MKQFVLFPRLFCNPSTFKNGENDFMNYFLAELKRAVLSRTVIIPILLILGSLSFGMVSSWDSITEFRGTSFFLYSFSLGSGSILLVVVPLIAVLPYSNSYLQDIENNMIYGILIRTTIKNIIS